MTGEVISMSEFNESKQDATNLTEEEKSDAEMEASLVEADRLLDFIAEESDHNPETLFFLWSNINDILVNALGWTRQELQDEIGLVEVSREESS